jgi:p38 MAP kinase
MKIMLLVGKPDQAFIDRMSSEEARRYIDSLPNMKKKDFFHYFQGANPMGK